MTYLSPQRFSETETKDHLGEWGEIVCCRIWTLRTENALDLPLKRFAGNFDASKKERSGVFTVEEDR